MSKKAGATPTPSVPLELRNKKGVVRTGHALTGRQVDKERLLEVQEMKEMLFGDSDVVRIISKKFRVSTKTVRSDLVRVKAAWAEEADADSPKEKQRSAARTAMRMFRRHTAKGEGKLAKAYFADYCKIVGAYAPDAIKLFSINREEAAAMTDEEIDKAIEVEIARAAGTAKATSA